MDDLVHTLPQGLLSKLRKIYPGSYQHVLRTFLKKKTPSFRANFLKTDLSDLRGRLRRARISFRELTFPEGAFLLKSHLHQFQNTELYQKGLVCVQNVSKMLPPIILEPQAKEKVFGLCASLGAQITQIASLAQGAEVVAFENSRTRYYKLLTSLNRQGVKTVKTYLYEGIWVRKKFPEYFDKVLIDAPCSAEAQFYVHNPWSFKYWSTTKVQEMVNTQKELMRACFFALKQGGVLVYAASTFSPEENEGIIDWFINKFKEKVKLLPIRSPLDNVQDGLVKWQDKKFSSDLALTKRVIPNEYMEGLFVAKLKKIAY
ncbi:MAG: RsmB/NOP family class I SAM-dependent RNA methyltransferase [Candidatus Omnitrophota bacterium]|nr:MAG: RsmB/NOP family class I SAM-dependent RNA methyltransferase [Candidatus Omnitrophota bacterium]